MANVAVYETAQKEITEMKKVSFIVIVIIIRNVMQPRKKEKNWMLRLPNSVILFYSLKVFSASRKLPIVKYSLHFSFYLIDEERTIGPL